MKKERKLLIGLVILVTSIIIFLNLYGVNDLGKLLLGALISITLFFIIANGLKKKLQMNV